MTEQKYQWFSQLVSRKSEFEAMQGKLRPKLELIRKDLSPLVEAGVSARLLREALVSVGISCSERHLRINISEMFPEAYSRHYKRSKRSLAVPICSNVDIGTVCEALYETEGKHADNEETTKNKHKDQSGKMLMESMLHDMRVYRGEE